MTYKHDIAVVFMCYILGNKCGLSYEASTTRHYDINHKREKYVNTETKQPLGMNEMLSRRYSCSNSCKVKYYFIAL